jgi:hypothetical protein
VLGRRYECVRRNLLSADARHAQFPHRHPQRVRHRGLIAERTKVALVFRQIEE